MKTKEFKTLIFDTDDLIAHNSLVSAILQYERIGKIIGGTNSPESPDKNDLIKESDKLLQFIQGKFKQLNFELDWISKSDFKHYLEIPVTIK